MYYYSSNGIPIADDVGEIGGATMTKTPETIMAELHAKMRSPYGADLNIAQFAVQNAREQFAGANDVGGYDTRAAAYNGAVDTLKTARKHGMPLDGVFVCKRRQGDFYVWPMMPNSPPPKSYKIVDEVYLP